MTSSAQLEQVWDLGELPFHVGAMTQPSNGPLPDRLPFRVGVDARSGLLVQMPDGAVEKALERAYRAGSAIGTPLAESGLGLRCRDDFLAFIERAVGAERLDGLSVLEIGSGGGAVLRALQRRGATVTGVEPGAKADPDAPFRVLAEPFRRDLFADSFDLIVHYGVTEHVGDPVDFMADQLSLLRPEGLIIFSVPDCEVPLAQGDISILVHEHWSYFTEATLAALAAQAGARVLRVEPAGVAGARYSAWAHGGAPGAPAGAGSAAFVPRATINLERLGAFAQRLRAAGSHPWHLLPGPLHQLRGAAGRSPADTALLRR